MKVGGQGAAVVRTEGPGRSGRVQGLQVVLRPHVRGARVGRAGLFWRSIDGTVVSHLQGHC